MTTARTIIIWAYDPQAKAYDPDKIIWLLSQLDALVRTQFAGGEAAASIINTAGNNKSAGFQIDLSGPEKQKVICEALEAMGLVPEAALPVTTTHAAFDCLER